MANRTQYFRQTLQTLAAQEGLYFAGAVRPAYPEDGPRFEKWLSDGNHGEMAFLEKHRATRLDPRQYFAPTRSVLIFCMSYWVPPVAGGAPQVASYARFRDYHKVLREKCERIASAFHRESGAPEAAFRLAVDSAPVLERALASQASEGFIGKNTLWIHPQFGSFVLLAEIFSELDWEEAEFDAPSPINLEKKTLEGGCGPCRQCQVQCPTGALDEAYRLDARKCLAYWTIENRGTIPKEYWPHLAKYYFGCDICQNACPYNIKPKARLQPPKDLKANGDWDLFTVATMDQRAYEKLFGGTPLTRAKRVGLRRNALIAMAVTAHPQMEEALGFLEKDGGFPLEETAGQIREYLSEQATQSAQEVLSTC